MSSAATDRLADVLWRRQAETTKGDGPVRAQTWRKGRTRYWSVAVETGGETHRLKVADVSRGLRVDRAEGAAATEIDYLTGDEAAALAEAVFDAAAKAAT